jgi:hypothetical protein
MLFTFIFKRLLSPTTQNAHSRFRLLWGCGSAYLSPVLFSTRSVVAPLKLYHFQNLIGFRFPKNNTFGSINLLCQRSNRIKQSKKRLP